jgi:hypothetical protein
MLGTAAVMAGRPELVSIEDALDDAIIAAAIGAPAGTTESEMLGVDHVRAPSSCCRTHLASPFMA